MIISPFLAVGLIMKVIAVIFVICSMVLVLIILIQKGKGGGLSAALGGAMTSGLLGSKTGDFLTWVTIVLVGIFLSLAVLMAKFYKPTLSEFGSEQTIEQQSNADFPPSAATDSNEVQATDASGSTGAGEGADVNESTDVNSLSG
jgi:preprotein translocase subunit SecG